MSIERDNGWEEIADSRLDSSFDLLELNEVATLAYKCVSRAPRKRPSMRDIVQVLSRIVKVRHNRKHQKSLSNLGNEVSIDVELTEAKTPKNNDHNHRREESVDSIATADTSEV